MKTRKSDSKGQNLEPLAVGDPVTAIVYGVRKYGTVARLGRALVFVRWNGAADVTWMHRVSLTKS